MIDNYEDWKWRPILDIEMCLEKVANILKWPTFYLMYYGIIKDKRVFFALNEFSKKDDILLKQNKGVLIKYPKIIRNGINLDSIVIVEQDYIVNTTKYIMFSEKQFEDFFNPTEEEVFIFDTDPIDKKYIDQILKSFEENSKKDEIEWIDYDACLFS